MKSKLLQFKRPNQDYPNGDSSFALLFLLGFLEFLAAAVAILLINKDPKNAYVFGYSPQRLGLFLLTLFFGMIMLVLAKKVYRGESRLNLRFLRAITSWTDISFLLFIAGWLVIVLHPSMLGIYGNYFERLRPLLLVLCFLPIQFSLKMINKIIWQFDKRFWFSILISFCAIILLTGFIIFSRLGVTPDKVFWNVAGMPLSSAQLIVILFGIIICLRGVVIIRKYIPNSKMKYIDLALCLAIFLCTVLVWNKTPFNGHFFLNSAAPYYQPFPFSDARNRDLGALSITKGMGISFGSQTNSPLYEVFLSVLHGLASYDYNLLTQLQIYFLALIPVVLYLFGKSFHNRFLGLLIASIILVRQSNAIFLSRMIASANPHLLTTEMTTFLGLSVFIGLVFIWLRKGEKHPWIALISGGILGMTSLIRVNPVLIFPSIPLFSLFAMWRTKKKWLGQTIAFLAGFIILVTPWIFTGVGEYGQIFFFQRYFNVIDTRYAPINQVPNITVEPASTKVSPSSHMRVRLSSERIYESETIIDIYRFPGFVFNHYFHNLVGAFLALPDSLSPADQILTNLALRPYWVEGELWMGNVKIGQIPFIFINLCLVSLGIGWSWKRWRWAGMVPLFIFLVYLLSLGLARTSGSRYIVPVDWVVFFYYSIGITLVVGYLLKIFKSKMEVEFEYTTDTNPLTKNGQKNRRSMILAIIFLLCIASFIPVADNLIPPEKSLCANESLLTTLSLNTRNSTNRTRFFIGQVLYPEISDNNLAFTLLTCQGAIPLDIENFYGQIGNGQTVIVGIKNPLGRPELRMILSLEYEPPKIIWAWK